MSSQQTAIGAVSTDLLTRDEIAERIDTVLARSTADETEIVWLETRGGETENRGQHLTTRPRHERTILIRVIDRNRVGSHRTGTGAVGELESAVRRAVAQSRSREPLPGMLHLPVNDDPVPSIDPCWDPAIADLGPETVGRLYRRWREARGLCRIRWTAAQILVFNSRGTRRQASVTAANLEVRIGRRAGGGRAYGAARTLSDLEPEVVIERARDRHAAGEVGDLPQSPVIVAFSPEATCQLCDILNRVAFSAVAYYQGSSFLREHLDVQVFDRAVNLRDDATDASGLPFPFDLEGTAKRPVDLIHKGTPKTPAVDQRQAAQMGLTPTASAIGGNDARAMNLFFLPGELDDTQILEASEDGLWVGSLDGLECFEPSRVQIRGVARGVRRIVDGKLDQGLPDFVWEDSLLRALSNLRGLGQAPVVLGSQDGFLGGISAPAMVIAGITPLRRVDS